MDNIDFPMPTNINWAAVVAAFATVFAYFTPMLPDNVRSAILTLIMAVFVIAVVLLHSLVNHPANVAKVKALLADAAQSGRRSAGMMLALLFPFFAVAVLAGALSACASNGAGGITGSPSLQQSVAKIANFAVADLENADAIAIANKDTMASNCFEGLETFVKQQQAIASGLTTNPVSGAFSAFEQGRVSLQDSTNLISQSQVQALEQACGPLQVDVQNQPALFLANLAAFGVKP